MIFRLSRPFRLVMLISEMLWMSVSVFGQGDIRDSLLSINDDPRPLAAVADLLERKLGLPISYEDVRWAAIDSIRAADHPANRERAQRNPEWKGPLIPRGGALGIRVRTDAHGKLIDAPIQILEAFVEDHTTRHNSGEFTVVQFGNNEFSIVPRGGKDATGKFGSQHSPFDTRISFPQETRTGVATLKLILEGIKAAGGESIGIGSVPYELLGGYEVLVGAQNETARDVLARAFREARWADPRIHFPLPKLSWRLFYDLELQAYVLNISTILHEVPERGGGVRLEQLVW